MRIFLAETDAYDPTIPGVITYRFSSGLGYDNAGTFYEPRMEQPGRLSRDVSSVILGGRGSQSYGEATFANLDGGLNGMADKFFDGREYRLFVGDSEAAYATFTKILSATIDSVAFERQRVSMRLRDRALAFDVPLSSFQYGGTNVLPNGIDGTPDDIKGQYKPVVIGLVSLMSPTLVNASKLIYQISAWPIDLVWTVLDAGAYLSRGADYTSQANMEATEPSPGTFRAWPAGGCIRLGSTPFGTVGVCVSSKLDHLQCSAAGVILQALQSLSFTDYVSADFTALDQKSAGPIGALIENGETVSALIDRITGTVGAWWGFDYLNRFRIGRLDAPSAPTVYLTQDDYESGSLERLPQEERAAWRVTMKSDINYAVQDKRSLAGVVSVARAAWLEAESRDQVSENATVKTSRLLAEERTYDGMFAGISQAKAEATRRLALLSARRDVVTLTLPDPASYSGAIDIGTEVNLTTDELGYASGRNFVVVGHSPDYQRNILDLTMWG